MELEFLKQECGEELQRSNPGEKEEEVDRVEGAQFSIFDALKEMVDPFEWMEPWTVPWFMGFLKEVVHGNEVKKVEKGCDPEGKAGIEMTADSGI